MSNMASSSASRSMAARNKATGEYLEASRRPWHCLVFLLPLIIAYEIGTLAFARDPSTGEETRIIAFNLLTQFFAWFGATGRYLPPMAVVGILTAAHVMSKASWEIKGNVLGGMFAECICWAMPLLAVAMLMTRYLPLSTSGFNASTSELMVLSLGAGIYEELVFRLIGFAMGSFILTDLMGIKDAKAAVWTLGVTSVAFSLYHYLGNESFQWQTFMFRTVAGVFFGGLYLWRGFGVTAGSHAIYDVIVHLLRP